MTWINLNQKVELRNKTFEIKDVEVPVHIAIVEINPRMWRNKNIPHLMKTEAYCR
jgi:hypothetical protein